MEQLAEFASNHLLLVGAFFAVLGLLVANLASSTGGVAPQAAVQLLNRENAVSLDVRSRAEFDAGHIIDALHVPLADLPERGDALKKHRDKPILVCCESGGQARQAARTLKRMGFERVLTLRGGIAAWKGDNLPLSKD